MTAEQRAQRTRDADALCESALAAAVDGGAETGVAMVAVGGYGRGELAPHSDLDVVLLHEETRDVGALAAAVWYPLWDAGAKVDHAVRELGDVTEAAHADARVALGLLDARHLAGDPGLTLRLRAAVLAQWRRDARHHLPQVRDMVRRRTEQAGELAHATVPDLKESFGGLRDATILKALVATWLVDVPHVDLERGRGRMLDVRDELHAVTGRPGDRVPPEAWGDLAGRLGLAGEEEAQRHVRELGRRLAHLARLTWRRVDAVLEPPPAVAARAPRLVPVAPGVAVSSAEVVLDRGADPGRDPHLLLRASAVAAERSLALNPTTAARLVRDGARLPVPWDAAARDLLVRLLAAGPGLLAVWETLDETGALARLLPEWERIRLLPHASVVHRFTVDRHSVETCIEASRLIRRVARPDLLLVAALLHDIGKGGAVDHSVAGEPVAVAVAARLGFDDQDSATVGRLVRHHLLLPTTATTRDLEDPATAEAVAVAVADRQTLDLLEVLAEADARATAPKAWSGWRSGLVHDLAARVRRVLTASGASEARTADPPRPPVDVPPRLRADARLVDVAFLAAPHGSAVRVVSADRVGLIADVAGAFALQRLTVRSARAWEQEGLAVSVWELAESGLDEAVVRQRLEAVLGGRLDPGARLRPAGHEGLDPVVAVHHEAATAATVLEVRVADRPGLLHDVCRTLAALGISVRSAHVTTVGPQAVDVFYVGEPGAGALAEDRAAQAAHAVREALRPAVTLEH